MNTETEKHTEEPYWFQKFSQWADDCPENRSVGNLNGLISELKEYACKGINPEAVPMMVEITELAQILSGDIVGAKRVTVAHHLRLMNLCEKAIAKAREINE